MKTTAPGIRHAVTADVSAKSVSDSGGDGVLLDGEDGVWQADVYRVPTVDATGTGDAFLAGYVYGLKQGADVPLRLKYGAALGASCVRAIGATTGVFNAAELEEYVRREPLKIERLGT